jgi:Tol biopolymer transport system component
MFRLISAALVLSALALAAPAQASRIAFVRDGDVYTMQPDGSPVQRLTALPAGSTAAFVSWSPDARRLVFTVFPPDEPGETWIMHADGTGLHKLLNDPVVDDLTPSFAPDGRHVIFVRCNEIGCAVHRVRTDGTRLQSITPFQPDIVDWAPTYSPDGERIAFGSFGRGGFDAATYLMHADGTRIRRITPPDLQILGGDWSPDGSRLTAGSNCCNRTTAPSSPSSRTATASRS